MTLYDPEEKKEFPPNLYISEDMARAMFVSTGKDFDKLKKKASKRKKPKSRSIFCEMNIQIERIEHSIEAENVLGYIEGGDKKEELIVMTAHYDHLGIKNDSIYNGADDDGSGTVSLLEMAEAFALAKEAGFTPRRSILLMPVAGEEKGLLGSRYYTEHPVFPIENTIADLNIDMIGRIDSSHEGDSNYVYIIGADKISKELDFVNREVADLYSKLRLDYTFNADDDPNRFYYRSDHYNFADKGVPVIFYFTGVHEDYHKPTDTIEKILFTKIENIARLVFLTAWELANREDRLAIDPTQE